MPKPSVLPERTFKLYVKTDNNTQCFLERNQKCMPNHMKILLSFTLKTRLTWEKIIFHQRLLPVQFLNFIMKTGNINQFCLRRYHGCFVNAMQYESKSLWKSLKNCVKFQTRLFSFNWRENWTGFRKCAILFRVSLKYLKVLFFSILCINPSYPRISGTSMSYKDTTWRFL